MLPVAVVDRQLTNPYNSDESTADTIRQMIRLRNQSAYTPLITSAVNVATDHLANSVDDLGIVRSVFYWIKENITFKTDEDMLVDELGRAIPEYGMELLKSPEMLLVTKTGDCDDFSTLISAMLMNLGFQTRFVTIAADKELPWKFSHVYVEIYLPSSSSWLPIDASHGMYPGWQHKVAFRKQYWN